MIDFKNAQYAKLKEIDINSMHKGVNFILTESEEVVSAFKGIRDSVIFTNKRAIAVNVQGLTGTKVDFTSLPYKNIVAFSVETAGNFDLDAELDLWFSGLGKVRFEFKGKVDIKKIGKMISEYALN